MTDTKVTPVVNTVDTMINYQTGSIVSHILLKGAKGSSTLFACDKGQEISEHTTPFDALVHVVEGNATVTISGVKYPMEAGQTLVMPAHDPHAVFADTQFKFILTMIRT